MMKVISDKYEFVSDCPKGYRLHEELLCGKQEFQSLPTREAAWRTLASLGWVTPGAATEGVTPLFS